MPSTTNANLKKLRKGKYVYPKRPEMFPYEVSRDVWQEQVSGLYITKTSWGSYMLHKNFEFRGRHISEYDTKELAAEFAIKLKDRYKPFPDFRDLVKAKNVRNTTNAKLSTAQLRFLKDLQFVTPKHRGWVDAYDVSARGVGTAFSLEKLKLVQVKNVNRDLGWKKEPFWGVKLTAQGKKVLKAGTTNARKPPKFKVGQKVKFKNDPEAYGPVREIDPQDDGEIWYRVDLGVGSGEWAEQSELKANARNVSTRTPLADLYNKLKSAIQKRDWGKCADVVESLYHGPGRKNPVPGDLKQTLKKLAQKFEDEFDDVDLKGMALQLATNASGSKQKGRSKVPKKKVRPGGEQKQVLKLIQSGLDSFGELSARFSGSDQLLMQTIDKLYARNLISIGREDRNGWPDKITANAATWKKFRMLVPANQIDKLKKYVADFDDIKIPKKIGKHGSGAIEYEVEVGLMELKDAKQYAKLLMGATINTHNSYTGDTPLKTNARTTNSAVKARRPEPQLKGVSTMKRKHVINSLCTNSGGMFTKADRSTLAKLSNNELKDFYLSFVANEGDPTPTPKVKPEDQKSDDENLYTNEDEDVDLEDDLDMESNEDDMEDDLGLEDNMDMEDDIMEYNMDMEDDIMEDNEDDMMDNLDMEDNMEGDLDDGRMDDMEGNMDDEDELETMGRGKRSCNRRRRVRNRRRSIARNRLSRADQETLNWARQERANRRKSLISQILNSCGNQADRRDMITVVKSMNFNQLQAMARTRGAQTVNYSGSTGGHDLSTNSDNDVLPLPTINWDKDA